MENKSRNVKFVLTFICGKCLDVIYGLVSPRRVYLGRILSTVIEMTIQTSNIIVTLISAQWAVISFAL